MQHRLYVALNQLVGTWRTEGRIIDGGPDHDRAWSGYDTYEWFPGEEHLVHRVDVTIFGERKEAIEFLTPRSGATDSIGGATSGDLSFDEISFDADGTVESGIGWFDAAGRYHNDSDEARATVTFDGPAAMRALWVRRRPDGSWTNWLEVSFTRVGPPHIEIRSKNGHTM